MEVNCLLCELALSFIKGFYRSILVWSLSSREMNSSYSKCKIVANFVYNSKSWNTTANFNWLISVHLHIIITQTFSIWEQSAPFDKYFPMISNKNYVVWLIIAIACKSDNGQGHTLETINWYKIVENTFWIELKIFKRFLNKLHMKIYSPYPPS